MTSSLEWVRGFAARFVVFEGPDGSGKTTQYRRFAALCESEGVAVCEVREPGGTAVGERIREILLDPAHDDMALRCEMLLYMASRAQLVEQRILPALQARSLVLADRFISSTLAYQGAAGGLPEEDIARVGAIAVRNLCPDLIVIFDVDERTAAERLNPLLGGRSLDRIEARDATFHARVRAGYLSQARAEPGRYIVIDASRSPDAVWESLLRELRTFVDRRSSAWSAPP